MTAARRGVFLHDVRCVSGTSTGRLATFDSSAMTPRVSPRVAAPRVARKLVCCHLQSTDWDDGGLSFLL